MADTADQEVIRIVANNDTEPGARAAEQRIAAMNRRATGLARIPVTVLDKATGPLRMIGEQFQSIARIAERASIASVASMMTLDIAHHVEEGITRVQEFGKATLQMARETGMSTEQASGLLTVMQEFGVTDPSRSLGLFARGLRGVEDASEKAMNGGKGVLDAIRDLGIQALDANHNVRPMEDVLADVADRFHAMPAGIDKTGIAMQLFGRNGREMLFFLNQGSEGIKEAMEAAKQFGMVITDENAVALKAFGLAQREATMATHGFELQVGLLLLPLLTRLTEAGTGVAQAMNQTLVPALGQLGTLFEDLPIRPMLDALLSLGGRVVTFLRGVLLRALTEVWELLSPARTFLGYALRWLIETAWPAFLTAMGRVSDFIQSTLLPRLHDLSDWLDQHIKPAFDWLGTTGWPAVQAAGSVVADWINNTAIPAFQGLANWMGRLLADPVGTLADLWHSLQDAMAPFAPTADRIGAAAGQVGKAFDAIRPGLESGATHILDFARGMADSATGADASTPAIQRVANVVNALSGALESGVTWLANHKEAQAAIVGVAAGTAAAFALIAGGNIAAAVATGIHTAAIWALVAAETAWDVLMAANPIGLFIIALTALAAALVFAYNTSDEFRDRVNGALTVAQVAFTNAKGALDAFDAALHRFFDDTGPKMLGALDAFDGALRGLLGTIGAALGSFDAWLRGIQPVRDALDAIAGTLRGLPGNVADTLFGRGTNDLGAAGPALPPTPPGANMTVGGNYQMGGWLTEPIVGTGLDTGRPYRFVENRRPEYVVPAGGAAPGGGGGGGHTFHFGGITIYAGPTDSPDELAEQVIDRLYGKINASLGNRPLGVGQASY